MSIIHDALKKTGQSVAATPTTPPPPPIIPPGQPSDEVKKAIKSKQGSHRRKVILLYILTVLIGVYVSNQFFGFLNSSPLIPTLFTKQFLFKKKPAVPAPSWPPEPSFKKEQPKLLENLPHLPGTRKEEPSLTLNGIFFSQGEDCYALINNRVVKAGDRVAGAKVVAIKPETVELEQDGKQVTLTTR